MLDDFFLERLQYDLIDIEEVLGGQVCQQAIADLYPVLSDLGKPLTLEYWMDSCLLLVFFVVIVTSNTHPR